MRFSLVVEMIHPSIEPDEVSEAVGWKPGWTLKPVAGGFGGAGEAGTVFGWGMRETCGGERLFFRRVVAAIEQFERRREFVRWYVETGGEVVFTIRLFGQVNIGDVLCAEDLMRMAMLGIALQVEVAPEWE